MLNLYDENGYFNFKAVQALGIPFNFIIGGRGTGKTYGALSAMLEDKETFMFTRRKQTQVDLLSDPALSPFKVINTDFCCNIQPAKIGKNISGFYDCEEDGKPEGVPIGYLTALKTFTNVRGFDASDVTTWIFDEFIPEPHDVKIKNESSAFLNMYESMNRNRELNGRKPIQCFCLSNSDSLNSEILDAFGLVEIIERMQKKGKTYRISGDKLTGVFLLSDSEISKKKEQTVLYRAAKNSVFAEVALDNKFRDVESGDIISRNISDYTPVCVIGDVVVYKHKTRRSFYVTQHLAGSPPVFSVNDVDKKRFRQSYNYIVTAILLHNVEFENYSCKVKFFEFLS